MKKHSVLFMILVAFIVMFVSVVSYGEVAKIDEDDNIETNDGGNEASENQFKKSDVFYAYPGILRKAEPALFKMYNDAQKHVKEMEDNGSETLAILQSALKDPEGGAASRFWSWLTGQDKMEERCTYDAIESLLENIIQDGYTGYENSLMSTMQGMFDTFKTDGKEIKNLQEFSLSIFKYWFENNKTRVQSITEIICDCADGSIYTKGFLQPEDIKEVLKDETGWISYFGDRLDNAEDFLNAVNTICLLETIDTSVLYTLRSNLSSEQMTSAVDKYIGYKASNYTSYIIERYLKKDLLSAAKEFISDTMKDAVNTIKGGGSFNALYSVAKGGLKLAGKTIGAISGIGDGDKFATAYYSWNIAQELERSVNNLRAEMITQLIYYDDIQEYGKVYELYAQAVQNFATSVGACDKEFKKNTLSEDETYLAKKKNDYGSAFDAYVGGCLLCLETAEDVNAYRRPVDASDIPDYSIGGTVTISGPSDELQENTIYTAPDGDLFYGLQLNHWSTVNFTSDCIIPTDLSYERSGIMHTITIPEGVTVRIRGDLDQKDFRERYYDKTTQDYLDNRRVDIHGSLIVEGNMRLNVCTFILSGTHASLEVDGTFTMEESRAYSNVIDTIDAESVLFKGSVNAPANFKEIGNTAIHLELDPGETASLYWAGLQEPEGGFTGEEPAALMFQGLGNRNDTFWTEYKFAEISGNAPSHHVKLSHAIQSGESTFDSISTDFSTITGDVSVTGKMFVGFQTLLDGKLHVAGDVEIVNTKSDYSTFAGIIIVGKEAQLAVDGNFFTVEVLYSESEKRTLTVSGTATINGNLTLPGGSLCLDDVDSFLEVMGDADINTALIKLEKGFLKLHGNVKFPYLRSVNEAKIILVGDNREEVVCQVGNPGFEMHGNGQDSNLAIHSEDEYHLHIGPADSDKAVCGNTLNILSWEIVPDDGIYDFAETVINFGDDNTSIDMNGKHTFTGNLDIRQTKLVQDKADSNLEIKGNLSASLTYSTLKAGQLIVGGDIVVSPYSSLSGTESHQTILNGTGVQHIAADLEAEYNENGERIQVGGFSLGCATLILSNESSEGVILGSSVKVSTLFNHQRRVFTLQSEDESHFADYDGDGIRDPWDPDPKDPLVSFIPFTVQPIADQAYTGDPVTPTLMVVDDEGLAMMEGKDYTVSWEDNTNSASAKAVVKGLGFHQTEVTAEFAILGGPSDPVYPGPNDKILIIGASIKKLEDEAFADCANVRFIYFKGDMPNFGKNVFSGVAKDAVIYYPEGNTSWNAEALKEAGITFQILPWTP